MINKDKKIKVAIGLSGGVDSAVAAMLLKQQGYTVIGLFLKFWNDPTCDVSRDNACCDEKAQMDARAVAAKLEMPFYVVDCREVFKKEITDYYLDEYKKLRTPNPCVPCNKKIKFGWMLDFAEKLGCEFVATGHYCRILSSKQSAVSSKLLELGILRSPGTAFSPRLSEAGQAAGPEDDKVVSLLKGVDILKDQSYFMWQLDQKQLSKIIFPLGEMTKETVRKYARQAGLPVSEKVESQEICFIQDKSYVDFLRRYLPAEYFKSGRIVDTKGWTIGYHSGLVNYTVGQRKGIEQIGYHGEVKEPLYVIGHDLAKNELIVGTNDDIYKGEMLVEDVVFQNLKYEKEILNLENVTVKIRYRAEAVDCTILEYSSNESEKSASSRSASWRSSNNKFRVKFKESQRAVTPGQSAGFYIGDELIGGGIIC
jgi:tRNA-specific 2-thiouridylase